jgi:ribosomal protein L15
MIKTVIGFSENMNKQLEVYKEMGQYKLLNLVGKKDFTNSLFIELDKNYVISICGINQVEGITEEFLNNLNANNKMLDEFNQKLESCNRVQMNMADYLLDAELINQDQYNQACNHNIKLAEENKIKELIKREEKEKRQNEEEAEFKNEKIKAEELYKNGDYINPEFFIILCEENNINIPIKVKGWLNSKVSQIAGGSYKSSTQSKTIWKYMRELTEAI